MSDILCKECGEPSVLTYCSKICANRAWKKSPGFLNKECQICGEPCHNMYCSGVCRAKARQKFYKENCLTCGKEFTFNREYKKRGGMKYCSLKCSCTVYDLNESFFIQNTNIPLLYQTLGFLYSLGKIHDYVRSDIEIRSKRALIDNFIEIVGSTYPVKTIKRNRKIDTVLIIRSRIMVDYLESIGLSHDVTSHEFPSILSEYKKYFIQGFVNTPNCSVHRKKDHNLVIIVTKSYHLIRGMAEVTGGDIVSRRLEFCLVFKDYERFYTKSS
jgi:hypothetical protein